MKRWKQCAAGLAAWMMLTVGGAAQAAANPALDWELYQALVQQAPTDNILFSPYGVTNALTLAYAASGGEAERQLAKALRVTGAKETALTEASRLNNVLSRSAKSRANLASSLWLDSSVKVRPELAKRFKQNFPDALQQADFSDHREESRQAVNSWAEDASDGRIKGFLQPDDAKTEVSLLLFQVTQQQSEWKLPFSKAAMRWEEFRRAGDARAVPMLARTLRTAYAEDSRFQLLELPYAGDELALQLLLPKDGYGAALNELTAAEVGRLQSRLQPREVAVLLPEFKLESRQELQPLLTALGVNAPFATTTDFSALSADKKLHVERVLQHSQLEVAASPDDATQRDALKVPPPHATAGKEATLFRADRPFVFAVVHKASGALLLLGKLTDPTKSGGILWQAEMSDYPGHTEPSFPRWRPSNRYWP